MTIGSARLFAPVATPPPPKPPQLNLVASALMPDVATDTFGPGAGPLLASDGWDWTTDEYDGRKLIHRLPGNVVYQRQQEEYNGLVAAVEAMSEVAQKAAYETAGVTPESLPQSIFGATADSRWTGGFRYEPENQSEANIADPCGQAVDLPAMAPPVAAGVNAAGGTLTSASYDYQVTALNANGETLPSNKVVVVVTGGSARLTWTEYGAGQATGGYNIYGRTHSATLHLLAHVGRGVLTYTDTGAATPGAQAVPGTDTTAGDGDYTNLALVKYVPFLIQVEDECSSWGFSQRDFVGRALRLLDNATPQALERELWQGVFAQNTLTGPMDGANQFFMQNATAADGGTGVEATDLTPGGGPPSITRGMQILEDYASSSGIGGQAMIHVAPETSPNLLGARRIGSLLLSVMDNIIVPGAGYPTSTTPGGSTNAPSGPGGDTPADGTAWMFVTDLVSVRLDKPVVTPDSLSEALDRGTFGQPNTIRFRAQRFGAATFDGARFAAVRVTLST